MIEEQAVVVAITENQAELEIIRRKPCGLCGQTQGCGISFWGRVFGHHRRTFRVENVIQARTGDAVVVGMDERAVLYSAAAAYGLPLLGMMLGLSLVSLLHPVLTDALALVGALLGLLFGYAWLKFKMSGGTGISKHWQPVMLRLAQHPIQFNQCR